MSTIKVTNVQNPSAASAAITLDTNGQATLNGLTYPTSGSLSGRSRIINGSMMIDQRNAGASVTITASSTQYITDRFIVRGTQASKLTAQQSSVAPSGFSNSLLCTSSSAYSITSSDYFVVEQRIEGYNTADLAFGTSAASTITLSFWVRSSLTGTFGGALGNSALDRTYPFSYTISSANTWEKKTVTLSGDTSGTWLTTNGIGLTVFWSLGAGATLSGTAGSWSGSTLVSATGATSVVGTNGATFYITGVQLEQGSTATPFERRSYGQELSLCQRYYRRFLALPGYQNQDFWQSGYGSSNALKIFDGQFSTMRSGPNVSLLNNSNIQYYSYAGAWTNSTLAVQTIGAWPNLQIYLYATADGDGRGKLLRVNNASGPEVIVVCDIEL